MIKCDSKGTDRVAIYTSTYNGRLCSKCTGPYKFHVFDCFVCRDNLYNLYVNVYLDLKKILLYRSFLKETEKEKGAR